MLERVRLSDAAFCVISNKRSVLTMDVKNYSPSKNAEIKTQNPQSPDEPVDVKPLFLPRFPSVSSDEDTQDSKQGNSGTKKWSPGKWQDANRKSAFQPYKQVCL